MGSSCDDSTKRLGDHVSRATGILGSRGIPWWVCTSVTCLALSMSIRAEGPSKTPLTDRAVDQIRRQAKHMARGNQSAAPEFFSALAPANFVQARISSLNHSILSIEKKKLPGSVEQCLEKRAGLCGNHVAAFLEISKRLKLRARPVEFYFRGDKPQKNHSHICVEVFYGDRWRLFDITWGSYFRRPDGALDQQAVALGVAGGDGVPRERPAARAQLVRPHARRGRQRGRGRVPTHHPVGH